MSSWVSGFRDPKGARQVRTLILACVLALSGCANLASVFMPTPVACAPKDSPSPPKTVSNDLLSKLDDYHMILVIAEERLELITYAAKADAVIQACK